MITPENYHYLHRIAKRITPFLKKENRFTKVYKREKNDEANATISELIKSEKPFMVARFGSVEAGLIVNDNLKKNINSDWEGILKTISGKINLFWKSDKKFLNRLCINAGFFPNNEELIPHFIQVYDEATKNLDVLGIWNEMEEFIPNIPTDTYLCKIRELEPWFYTNPWSQHLEGKKVLIIHPFEESIRRQYQNERKHLYKPPNILPEFELKTIKAVQTIAGESSEYSTWFDALDSMKEKIDKTDFDIAIIGCGAYGFPLASYIKDMGKQAIHLGGVTQLLFGIKGKRWEDWEHYTKLRANNGKSWITAKEIPTHYKKVEGGCYW